MDDSPPAPEKGSWGYVFDRCEDDARRRAEAVHQEKYGDKGPEHFWDPTFYSFPQLWADTSLGMGGPGGQAITRAQTIIVANDEMCWVYIGGQYAYRAGVRDAARWAYRQQVPGRMSRRAELKDGTEAYKSSWNTDGSEDG